jgi:hypothetical protein
MVFYNVEWVLIREIKDISWMSIFPKTLIGKLTGLWI